MKNLRRLQANSNRKLKHEPRPHVHKCEPGDEAFAGEKLKPVRVAKINAQTGQMTDKDGKVWPPGSWRPVAKTRPDWMD